jgi:hypothetical protein
MLVDGGVYPNGYEYSDGQLPQEPNNLDEVVQRLSQPQPALSSTVSDRKFIDKNLGASTQDDVKALVISLFLGDTGSSNTAQKNVLFNNLTSPADSLKEEDLKKAKPDYYYGSRPEQANANVRKTLSRHIVPSSSTNLPIAPNFFIEVRGPKGRLEVAQRQAWYDGVIGARAMHSLLSYNNLKEPIYDNNIYTLSAVYDSKEGEIYIYGHSMAQPNTGETRPKSYTFKLGSWIMKTDKDSYVRGLTALKNAEEWAKEVREAAIKDANKMEFQTVENEEGTNDEEQECIEETW